MTSRWRCSSPLTPPRQDGRDDFRDEPLWKAGFREPFFAAEPRVRALPDARLRDVRFFAIQEANSTPLPSALRTARARPCGVNLP